MIRCLLDDEGPLTVREISEAVAEMEFGERPPSSDLRKSVYVTLHQHHLSKLEDAGVVRYDADTNKVDAGPAMDQVADHLVETEDGKFAKASVLLSPAGALVAAVAIVGVSAVSATQAKTITLTILYLILLASIYSVVTRLRRAAVA